MNRLLLVEDDEVLALAIEFTLKNEGYEVLNAATIEKGKLIFDSKQFDLAILDVNLPDGSGYDLCKYIRNKSDVPIMFLTALDEKVNIVLGLEIGGDDYITKPFEDREFLSRIKALIRRNATNISTGLKFKSGDIIVDDSLATVKKNGKDIILTAQEYRLLLIFMSKPKKIMKRDEILSLLMDGVDVFFDENTLSVYIKRIREKLEDIPKEPKYIITQRGLGYRWNQDVIKE